MRNSRAGKLHRQQLVLQALSEGLTVRGACAKAGIKPKTYEGWRIEDPEWGAKASEFVWARRKGRDLLASPDGDAFAKFRALFFDHSTPHHHRVIVRALTEAQPDSLTVVLAFPEAAKTSLLVDYINYKLGPVDPNYRIAVISEGQDLARKIIGQVSERMTDTEQFGAYISTYGPFRTPLGEGPGKAYKGRTSSKPWNADYLTVFHSSHDEKEPSLESRGWTSKLYGGRYDLLVIDDIQSDGTLNQTRSMLRYIRQTVLTRPAKGKGKTVVIGSRVGVGDIYQTLAEEQVADTTITIPALTRWVDRDEHFTVIDGVVHVNPDLPASTSAWPEYWSVRDLAIRRKKVGEEVWARTYMQRTASEADATFTEDMLEAVKDDTRTIGPTVAGTFRILSVDPALDKGICAYLVAAGTPDRLHLLDQHAVRDTRRYEDIYAHVASLAARYRPNFVIVEQNNFQKGLHQDDRMLDVSRRFGFQIVPHQTHRNKHDSVLGVAMMASAFVDREVSVPWADDDARRTFGPLFDELRLWRPTKRGSELTQDRVMTLWFAWLHWQQMRRYYTPQDTNVIRRPVPSWLANRPRGMSA